MSTISNFGDHQKKLKFIDSIEHVLPNWQENLKMIYEIFIDIIDEYEILDFGVTVKFYSGTSENEKIAGYRGREIFMRDSSFGLGGLCYCIEFTVCESVNSVKPRSYPSFLNDKTRELYKAICRKIKQMDTVDDIHLIEHSRQKSFISAASKRLRGVNLAHNKIPCQFDENGHQLSGFSTEMFLTSVTICLK